MTENENRPKSRKVGKLRPSQVVTQHGPGAVVDLPTLSVIVAGLPYWRKTEQDRVAEPRLEAFLRVTGLYHPPMPGPKKFGGLPSFEFPRFLVCPDCRRLAPVEEFSWVDGVREYVCVSTEHGGRRDRVAFPARFMVACPRGHLDDFPWRRWAHNGLTDCRAELKLEDRGFSGAASDLFVRCISHGGKSLGSAFDRGAITECSGRRPWLGLSNYHAGCPGDARVVLRGASNAYFPLVASALSIPPWSDPVHQAVAPYREQLRKVDSLEKLRQGIEGGFYDIQPLLERGYSLEQIWEALSNEPDEAELDLRPREYDAFNHPDAVTEEGAEFEVQRVDVPKQFQGHVGDIVAGQRLREVRALRGFTRIDAMLDLGERTDVGEIDVRVAPLGHKEDRWLPGVELRGEGIFLRLDEGRLGSWESRPDVMAVQQELVGFFDSWWRSRDFEAPPFPGMRYVLLHSLAHVLIRQMALECGYSSGALRERVYSSTGTRSMAAILVYTASSDSEGSLGGLVDLVRPERLGPILQDALRSARYCASDPLCGDRESSTQGHLNGSACHACLLLAETSCEAGNRLLDRNSLVDTVAQRGVEFFDLESV